MSKARQVALNLYMDILYLLPKRIAHKLLYKKRIGRKLALDNPKNLNEKIQYLILNKYGDKEGKLADKQSVKSYVERLQVGNLLIPRTIKIYKTVDDIDTKELPEKFVLKCNHGSGVVFICKDKENFDLDGAKKSLKKCLKQNFAKTALEYHYSTISPVIIAEEYLDDGKHKNPIDYKIYCFNGKAESILVCSNRENKLKLNDFDLDWNELDYTTPEFRSSEKFEKPKHLKEMIMIAEQLSKGIPFVRIDLYEIGDKIYFGEYTFTPAAGLIQYYKQKALDRLGEKLDLNWYN